jgi:hypothetical protein
MRLLALLLFCAGCGVASVPDVYHNPNVTYSFQLCYGVVYPPDAVCVNNVLYVNGVYTPPGVYTGPHCTYTVSVGCIVTEGKYE